MFKITSFVALIVGLLLALPIFLAETEASRGAIGDEPTAQRSDRIEPNSIETAFRILTSCQASLAVCHSGMPARFSGVTETMTVEERDEANHTSTLIRVPARN